MFDISWTEILIIAVIAIIVVGPKELPGMLRAFGRTFGQVRRTAREFQNTFNDALREAERQAKLDEVKKDLDQVRSIDPTADMRKGIGDARASLNEKVDPGARAKRDAEGGEPAASSDAQPPAAPVDKETEETPAAGSDVVPLKGGERPGTPGTTDGDDRGEPPRAAAGGERR